MCYGSPDLFDNVDGMASYEDLVRTIDDLEVGTALDRTLSLNPDGLHAHGSHVHAHGHGGHPHDHAGEPTDLDRWVVPDGGTTSISARIPTYETDAGTLLEHARYVVTASGGRGDWGRSGNIPGYDLERGDRVLLVVDPTYDEAVVDAFREAFYDEGASIVDTVTLHFPYKDIHEWYDECPGITYPDDPIDAGLNDREGALTPDERVARGYRLERRYLNPESWSDPGDDWWEFVAGEYDYDLLVYGIGGPTPLDMTERGYRYERMPWRTTSSLASGSATFPRDVWQLIDEKNAEVVTAAEEIHLTDPEGTDLRWTNYVTGSYPRHRPCHVLAHPLFPTAETDTEGVIAGTTNHVNAFPAIEVEIEDAKVVDVSGGGVYGELWRESLEVARDYDGAYGDLWRETWDERHGDFIAEYDYYDGSPGFFWLWEAAIGSNPKYARPQDVDLTRLEFPLIERMRAGVVHMGMGTVPWEPLERKAKLAGLPWGHVHIHLLFPTLECSMPDGRTVTLIEDGYLATLDDPEVRERAARHGDPDEVLSIEWVPDIPGISSDGDYQEYARDAKAWIAANT